MKIVIFVSFFLPHQGGAEHNNWQIGKRLAQTNEVVLVTCNTEGAPAVETMDGMQVVRLDSWNLVGNWYPVPKPTFKNYRLLRSVFKSRPDAIISNTRFYLLTLLAGVISRIQKIPHTLIERGANHTIHPSKIVETIAKIYDLTLGRLAYQLADKIAGQSQASLDFVRSLGIKNKPMFVAYNGIEVEKFLTTQYNFNRILFVGRLIRDKGCHLLIEAFKKLAYQHPKLELWIVGDGPERSKLEQFAQGFNVKFLGQKNYQEMQQIYSECGIYVNLSHSNGLSTTILEAGSAGLIVVASDLSGARELITKDRGLLFDLKSVDSLVEKIEFIIKNQPIYLGKNLQKYIRQNFDWNNLVADFRAQLINTN